MSVQITQTGLDLLINADAGGTNGIILTDADLYSSSEKIKRMPVKAVQIENEVQVHVTVEDNTADSYELFQVQFITGNGVIFAIAKNEDNSLIQAKSAKSALLVSFTMDISDTPGTIQPTGDNVFYGAMATEQDKGIAAIATQTDINTGTDDSKIITPKKLAGWWGVTGSTQSDEDIKIVEYGSNSYGNYRTWSNDSIEQWGILSPTYCGLTSNGYVTRTINLPMRLSNSSYTIISSLIKTNLQEMKLTSIINVKYSNYFSVLIYNGSSDYLSSCYPVVSWFLIGKR